jgi:hypothetical protein
MWRQPADQFDNSNNRSRKYNQIAALHGLHRIGDTVVNSPHSLGPRKHLRTIATDNLSPKAILPQRKPKRAANKARANDRDLAYRHVEIESSPNDSIAQ